MNANEFVKKFGWDRAKEIINGAGDHHRYFIADSISVTYSKYSDCFDSIDALKRLVESHEMVERFGGLDKAKKSLETAYKRFTTKISYSVETDDKTYLTGVFIEDLEQAITDVESCL